MGKVNCAVPLATCLCQICFLHIDATPHPWLRALWTQVLSSFREIAATALTVKSAHSAVEALNTFMKADLSEVASASNEGMKGYKQNAKSFANVNEILRQLGAANDEVQGASDAYAQLLQAKEGFEAWLDTLFPNFGKALQSLETWADNQVSDVTESTDWKVVSTACPKEKLQLPEEVRPCNSFILRCFLAVLESRVCWSV